MCITLLMLFQFNVSAELCSSVPDLFANDTLYVWAEGGLSLRLTDNIDSEKITVIPFGEEVQFLEYGRKRNKYEVLFFEQKKDSVINSREYKCNEYKQSGIWYKVRFGKVEGFAFSGYLSRYKTPFKAAATSISLYLEQNYKLISSNEFSKDYDIIVKNLYYEQGISQLMRSEKGGEATFIFPNMTLEESLLLLRKQIEYSSINNKICLSKETKLDGDRVLYFTNNTNWEISIKSISGTIVISQFVWC